MNLLFYGTILISLAAVVCWLFVYWFFRKTFVLLIGSVFLAVIAMVACFGLAVGVNGLMQLTWAVPIAIVCILASYYLLSQQVQKPIVKLTEYINQMSNNDLSIKVDDSLLSKKMEIGIIANSIEKLIENSRNLVKEIHNNSALLNESSKQLISSSQALTRGASVQASNLEEISASIEEMTANIKANAANAHSSSQLSEDSSQLLTISHKQAQKVSEMIHQMDTQLKSIKEIAEKTNILAINASIESVKSGEFGRGFSVVAKEVRNLAEQSKETGGQIIENSQVGVQNIDSLTSEIEQLVGKNTDSLNSIKEVASASEEMSIGASQINSAIQELNSIGQENAAASEEVNTTAEQLNQVSELLNKLLNQYKLN